MSADDKRKRAQTEYTNDPEHWLVRIIHPSSACVSTYQWRDTLSVVTTRLTTASIGPLRWPPVRRARSAAEWEQKRDGAPGSTHTYSLFTPPAGRPPLNEKPATDLHTVNDNETDGAAAGARGDGLQVGRGHGSAWCRLHAGPSRARKNPGPVRPGTSSRPAFAEVP